MTRAACDSHPRRRRFNQWLTLTIAACVAVPGVFAAPAVAAADRATHEPELSLIDVEQPPEDIVPLPKTHWVVLSANKGADHPGGLSLVNSRTEEETALWPVEGFTYAADLDAFPGCATPPSEALPNTHGINVVRTGARTFDLYVVYHGSRESIEVFSLDVRGEHPTASWRGCVEVPEGVLANSVVGLPDGGFAITKFWDSREPLLPQLFSGEPSGSLWTWHQQSGWTEVPGSDMFGPNGIEVSADGETLYTAETMKKRVVAIPTDGGPQTVIGETQFLADNLRWTNHGTLLTTGAEYVPLTMATIIACARGGFDVPDFCISGFIVAEIDPSSGTSRTLYSTDSPEYRYATVAAQVGKEIWVGGNAVPAVAVVSKLHPSTFPRSKH